MRDKIIAHRELTGPILENDRAGQMLPLFTEENGSTGILAL